MAEEISKEARQRLRGIAREQASRVSEQILETAKAGGDAFQRQIDLDDDHDVFVRTLPLDEQDIYREMYAQEMGAATARMNAETDRLNSEAAKLETETANYNQFIGAIVVAVVVVIVLMAAR